MAETAIAVESIISSDQRLTPTYCTYFIDPKAVCVNLDVITYGIRESACIVLC